MAAILEARLQEFERLDPQGVQFVTLLGQAQNLPVGDGVVLGDRRYIMDWIYTGDSATLHPALASARLAAATPEQILTQLVSLESTLGNDSRSINLKRRIDGLSLVLRQEAGDPSISSADIAQAAYGFDPRDVPAMTTDDIVAYHQMLRSRLPASLQPQTDDAEKLRNNRLSFLRTLRIPQLFERGSEGNVTRAAFADTALALVRQRAASMGIALPEIKIIPKLEDRGNQTAQFTFHPENSTLELFFNEHPDKQVIPHEFLHEIAHELGHALHLNQMYKDGQKGHTERMVFAAASPELAEGMADGFAYCLYPDAESLLADTISLYRGINFEVDSDNLRHYIESGYRLNPPGKLKSATRLMWQTLLEYEALALVDKSRAESEFVQKYQKRLLESEADARATLQTFSGNFFAFGQYIFTYGYQPAYVIRRLIESGNPPAELVKMYSEEPPTGLPSPATLI